MSTQLDRIEAVVTKLDERLDSVDVTLARQAVSLDEHMRRTEANEKAVAVLHAELAPLKAGHIAWGYAGKGLAALATAFGVVETVLHWLGK